MVEAHARVMLYCKGPRCRRFLAEVHPPLTGRIRVQCPACKTWWWVVAGAGGEAWLERAKP